MKHRNTGDHVTTLRAESSNYWIFGVCAAFVLVPMSFAIMKTPTAWKGVAIVLPILLSWLWWLRSYTLEVTDDSIVQHEFFRHRAVSLSDIRKIWYETGFTYKTKYAGIARGYSGYSRIVYTVNGSDDLHAIGTGWFDVHLANRWVDTVNARIATLT